WDGTNWGQRLTVASPSPRAWMAAAYDSRRGRTVIFGGSAQGGGLTNETWEYDGTNWNQRFPAHTPSARAESGMAYDAAHGVTVLYGGSGRLSDTWEWDGTDWSQRTPATNPYPRMAFAMRSEEHTSELQSLAYLVCRLLLEK